MGLSLGLLLVLQQPIILDGHIDTPQRMLDMKTDISARLPDGHVDIPRMQEGGLSAAFFSIWVDARYGPGSAFKRALALMTRSTRWWTRNRWRSSRPTRTRCEAP